MTPYGWASFSACGRYRYALGRVLTEEPRPRWLWVLLNPSKAGADFKDNDPTARKVIGFSQRYNVATSVIVNPNALIETSPKRVKELRRLGIDVCGPENDKHILAQARLADRIIVGWGGNIDATDRARVLRLLAGHTLWSLGVTQGGEPAHPLMLAYATPLVPYEVA